MMMGDRDCYQGVAARVRVDKVTSLGLLKLESRGSQILLALKSFYYKTDAMLSSPGPPAQSLWRKRRRRVPATLALALQR